MLLQQKWLKSESGFFSESILFGAAGKIFMFLVLQAKVLTIFDKYHLQSVNFRQPYTRSLMLRANRNTQ
jgi:hypothetical protein